MDDKLKSVTRSLADMVGLAVLVACVPYIIVVDVTVLQNAVTEHSLTEYLQATLLLISAVLFVYANWQRAESCGFLVLLGGLLGCICMFVRELDGFLDQIPKGFWVYPAALLGTATCWYAWKHRHTISPALSDFVDSRPAVCLMIGMLITLVFSRIFGARLLWFALLPEEHTDIAKRIVQEGLELLGYLLVAFGAYSHSIASPPVRELKVVTFQDEQSPVVENPEPVRRAA